MTDDRQPINVGRELADILKARRPDMPIQETVAAIEHALERYSIEAEGSGETKLRGVIYELIKKLEARARSI